jgi:hypothetical protein
MRARSKRLSVRKARAKGFSGYVVDDAWRKLEIFHFDVTTYRRFMRTVVLPHKHLALAERYAAVAEALLENGIPVPPPNF